jgi:4-hydroxybenzoate polyprenyltransferase
MRDRDIMDGYDTRVAAADALPLVVDLDGTLIRTDMLAEGVSLLASSRPSALASALLAGGRSAVKAAVARAAAVDVAALPYNEDVLSYVRAARALGRPVYLATGSDRRCAEAVAAQLGLFDGVFASEGGENLVGAAKAALLCERFGERGFEYVGNSGVDLAVWARAAAAVVVGGRRLEARARGVCPRVARIAVPGLGAGGLAKALRVHQWLKNLLVFCPVFAAHDFGGAALAASLAAFVAFSLCASGVYLLNDFMDIANDRAHPSKRRRPLASGRLGAAGAAALVAALFAASALLASALPWRFWAVMAGYFAATTGYSLRLKRVAIVDAVVLACLYGTRILAGGVAAGVALSPWLLAFALFFFLSLALVKRCAELVDRLGGEGGDPAGRGYRLSDLPALQGMAAGSGYVAVLVMALYINSPDVEELYSQPTALWGVCLVLLYWISRMLLLTHRGEMHEDPVVFAASDRVSLVCFAAMAAVIMGASLWPTA